MKGDFTRMTFDKAKRFSRVLMQQGRVQLDADWNEQVSILLHYLRSLAEDLIGPHGGPGDSFKIIACRDADGTPLVCPADDQEGVTRLSDDFFILPGHYYVHGVLCELESPGEWASYLHQPNYPAPPELANNTTYLVYLDVWERHISYLEDEDENGDEPSIREVALGGPDTTSRARVVWQVKVAEMEVGGCPHGRAWDDLVNGWQPPTRGLLQARARAPEDPADEDPCAIPPDARYRGPENQLYRVEVHRGGTARSAAGGVRTATATATFKWSRENGSVVFPIDRVEGTTIVLGNLGRDDRFSLHEGDWVEIVDDDYILLGRAEPLLQVESVDRSECRVIVKGTPTPDVGRDPAKHPLLRRWDQRAGDPTRGGLELDDSGTAPIQEKTGTKENWLSLESGVQIQFVAEGQAANVYRTGDCWLIPARTATGDVEWPGSWASPAPVAPHGVEHYYAPLAIIELADDAVDVPSDCRYTFGPVAQSV